MLSDIEIVERLTRDDETAITITPILSAVQVQPASVDVRLGFHFKVVKNARVAALDPIAQDEDELRRDTERYTDDIKLLAGEAFFIHPGDFALGTTLEYIGIPSDLAATLEGRSSLGRLGITIHSTAGFIDPGFNGRITYEIQNEGTQTVALYPGMRVAQLCFMRLTSDSIKRYGRSIESKYNQQLTTTSSRWYSDADLRLLRQRFRQRRDK